MITEFISAFSKFQLQEEIQPVFRRPLDTFWVEMAQMKKEKITGI